MSAWCLIVVALVGATACGRVSFQDRPRADSGGVDPDAPGACDPAQPFGAAVEITSLDVDDGVEGTLRLRPDELVGYFWSNAGGATETDLYRATRADLASPFAIESVPSLNTTAAEVDPAISSDGQVMVFRRSGPGDVLYVATAVSSGFGNVRVATELKSGGGNEVQPFLQLGGDELYFSSKRSGAGDLYRATRTGTAFSTPELVAEVSSSHEEGDPVISPDGRTLYFRSDRPGTRAGFNVWMARRASPGDAFGAPVEVPNVSSDANEGPSWLSLDDCRLYLSSDRSGTNEIYVATRGGS